MTTPVRKAIRANWILGVIFGPLATAAALVRLDHTLAHQASVASIGLGTVLAILMTLPTLLPFALYIYFARRVALRPGNETATAVPICLSAVGASAVNLSTCWAIATAHGTGSQFIGVLVLFPLPHCVLVLTVFLLFVFVWESWTWMRVRRERERPR